MGFSGGIWTWPSLPGSWNPAISGQAATPADWNTYSAAGAQGLSTMICRDGQSTVTADIPFANFRLKGVGNGILATDAANMSQLVSGAGIYAADTGAADLYAIAPTPAISAYAVGQIFRFKVAHANITTTPTLAINGLTAGVISWDNGALAAGDLPTNGMVQVIVASATPTFHLQTPIKPLEAPIDLTSQVTGVLPRANGGTGFGAVTPLTNSLSGDVALNNVSNYFDGPSVAQGSTGTWFVSGTITITNLAATATQVKLWDGTTVIASAFFNDNVNTTVSTSISLSGFLASPAGNLRISARDTLGTGGSMVFNASGNSKDCTISAFRIV